MYDYTYDDIGYRYSSVHRRVHMFNPRLTENPLIHEYFMTADGNKREQKDVYYTMLSLDRVRNANGNGYLPISLASIQHQFNASWVDLITQMIFRDKAYGTFIGEYKRTIEDIILYDRQTSKEYWVYRNHETGDTIFHHAGKIALYSKFLDLVNKRDNVNLEDELKYIIKCYRELGLAFGKDRECAFIYLMDQNNQTLEDTLTMHVNSLLMSIQ